MHPNPKYALLLPLIRLKWTLTLRFMSTGYIHQISEPHVRGKLIHISNTFVYWRVNCDKCVFKLLDYHTTIRNIICSKRKSFKTFNVLVLLLNHHQYIFIRNFLRQKTKGKARFTCLDVDLTLDSSRFDFDTRIFLY